MIQKPRFHYRPDGTRAKIRWPKQASFEGEKCYGWMDPDTGEIAISTKYHEHTQAWALLHEFLHEIYPEWGEPMVLEGEGRIGDHIVRNVRAWEWILSQLRMDSRPGRAS